MSRNSIRPNKAHAVDAPIASLFHMVRHWRRATDVHVRRRYVRTENFNAVSNHQIRRTK